VSGQHGNVKGAALTMRRVTELLAAETCPSTVDQPESMFARLRGQPGRTRHHPDGRHRPAPGRPVFRPADTDHHPRPDDR
jgi:hypothetical protein